MKFFIYLSPFIYLLLLAVTITECSMQEISINILYEMIYMCMYVCTGVHEGQTLERAVNMIIILFYILAIIHILSGI